MRQGRRGVRGMDGRACDRSWRWHVRIHMMVPELPWDDFLRYLCDPTTHVASEGCKNQNQTPTVMLDQLLSSLQSQAVPQLISKFGLNEQQAGGSINAAADSVKEALGEAMASVSMMPSTSSAARRTRPVPMGCWATSAVSCRTSSPVRWAWMRVRPAAWRLSCCRCSQTWFPNTWVAMRRTCSPSSAEEAWQEWRKDCSATSSSRSRVRSGHFGRLVRHEQGGRSVCSSSRLSWSNTSRYRSPP